MRERERGTLEQLIVTPIDKTSLMLGKILPFLLIGYVQITVILVARPAPVPTCRSSGSLPLLYLLSLAFIVASLALGLLMSTLVRSQVQAMQLSFLFLLPNILLSGFMFPRAGDAGAGPVDRRRAAAHLLPHDSPRRPAQGRRVSASSGPRRWPSSASRSDWSSLSVMRFHKTIE